LCGCAATPTSSRSRPGGSRVSLSRVRHVAHAGADLRDAAEVGERRRRAVGEHGEELLELAALALPADPALLALGEAALAVQHDEARRLVRGHRVERVDALDGVHRGVEQGGVIGPRFAVRIGPVGEQGELHAALRIGEVMKLQLVRERRAVARAGQHRRDNDHGPVLGRDSVQEGEPGQVARPRRFADQRLMTATAASEAGASISRAASTPSHAGTSGARAALWRSSSHATIVPVASATAPR
jgi:hypothetical protein